MTKSVRARILPLIGCLILAPAARGQTRESSPSDLELARELFSDATALEGRADWAAATLKLKRALAIKETPGLRYHLAHCEEQLGALVLASMDYERASVLIRDGAPAPDVEPLLPLAARRLDSRIAKLDVVVPSGTSAVVELDGRVLPPSAVGASIRLDPGLHRVLVRSPGQKDYQVELTLSTGERRTLKLFFRPESPLSPALGPAPAAAVGLAASKSTAPAVEHAAPAGRTDSADASAGWGPREVALIGEAALTLTGVGLGLGYALARGRASERVDAAQSRVDTLSAGGAGACYSVASPACVELRQAIDEHQKAAVIETAGFVGAGVAAGLFAATWALWPSARRGVAVTLHPRASGALLLADGVF